MCIYGVPTWLENRNRFCSSSSLETSPITDTDLAKRTVFQRSYSVVASEYDKPHSILPARVKAIPRRRVNSGDAGEEVNVFPSGNWCGTLELCSSPSQSWNRPTTLLCFRTQNSAHPQSSRCALRDGHLLPHTHSPVEDELFPPPPPPPLHLLHSSLLALPASGQHCQGGLSPAPRKKERISQVTPRK